MNINSLSQNPAGGCQRPRKFVLSFGFGTCSKTPRRTGFTYIEVAIVMLVMGILAAIAAPTYVSALAHYRADLAAQRIVADLHYARSEAQRNSLSRNVVFDIVTNSYSLVDVMNLDNSANNYIVNLVEGPFPAELLSATFGVNSHVSFDRFGRPDNVGTIVVRSGSVQQTIDLAIDGTATRL